jgi:hypothetical protein
MYARRNKTARAIGRGLEHVSKKLLDFFDQNMLQLIDLERILIDWTISIQSERAPRRVRLDRIFSIRPRRFRQIL